MLCYLSSSFDKLFACIFGFVITFSTFLDSSWSVSYHGHLKGTHGPFLFQTAGGARVSCLKAQVEQKKKELLHFAHGQKLLRSYSAIAWLSLRNYQRYL